MDDILKELEQVFQVPYKHVGQVVDYINEHYAHLLPTLPPHQLNARLNIFLLLMIGSEVLCLYNGSVGFKTLASLSFFLGGLERAFAPAYGPGAVKMWPRLVSEAVQGKLANKYSQWMLLGLALSVLGDVALIPNREQYFKGIDPAPQPKAVAAPPETPSKKTKKERKAAAAKKDGEWKEPAAVAAPVAAPAEEGPGVWFKAGTFFFALAHIAYTVAFLVSPTATEVNWRAFASCFGLSYAITTFLGMWGSEDPILRLQPDMAPLVKGYTAIITTMVAVATSTDDGYQKTIGAWMFLISDLFVAVDAFGEKRPRRRNEAGRPGWVLRSIGWVFYFYAQLILAGTIY